MEESPAVKLRTAGSRVMARSAVGIAAAVGMAAMFNAAYAAKVVTGAVAKPHVAAVATRSVEPHSARLLANPELGDFTSYNIRTLTLDSYVVREIRPELNRIDGDFKEAYRFHNVAISYVQPDKLHFETVVAGAHIAYTINGNKKYTSVPTFHVHKVEDTTGAPGKKQSLLDMGLVPPELLNLYYGTFLRREGSLLVFQISPRQRSERFKDIVWIDPVTRITTKREHYNQDSKLIAWYEYLLPTQPRPRMYVPTRVEVYNPENRLAAVTRYSNIKVNLPVDGSIFDF